MVAVVKTKVTKATIKNQNQNQQLGAAQSAAQMAQVANAQSMANQGGGGLLGGLATGGLSNLWAWNQRRRGRNQLNQMAQGNFGKHEYEDAMESHDRIHKAISHLSIRQSISKSMNKSRLMHKNMMRMS